MRRLTKLIVGMAVVAASGTSAQAATYLFTANLSGLNENPVVATPGSGVSTITLDDVANLLTIQATFSRLIGNTTASHIHCCTLPTGNVGVATTVPSLTEFPLGVRAATFSQTLDLNLSSSFNPAYVGANGGTVASARTALVNGMFANLAYLNIHTTSFPGGEIRGQIISAVPEPTTWGMMLLGFGAVGYSLRSARRGKLGLGNPLQA